MSSMMILEYDDYVPTLDNPFTIEELGHAVDGLDVNKSYLGICQGIARKVPVMVDVFSNHSKFCIYETLLSFGMVL